MLIPVQDNKHAVYNYLFGSYCNRPIIQGVLEFRLDRLNLNCVLNIKIVNIYIIIIIMPIQ